MRRKDREITDINEIVKVMKKCDVCRLGLNDEDGPYIVPLNFGMSYEDGKIELFFHSALEGHKLDLIRKDPRASFEMDCDHQLQYFKERGYCTYAYESVVGKGNVAFVEEEDKAVALQRIMDHYHPGENAYFNPDAIPRTTVYKLTVETVTGRRKEIKK